MSEQCRELYCRPAAVEASHAGCGGSAELSPAYRVVEQVAQTCGDCFSPSAVDQQPAPAIVHRLWDAADAGRDHRRATRHRFEEHVGDAVAVAVVGHPRRECEHIGALIDRKQLCLRAGPAEVHVLLRSKLIAQTFESLAARSVAIYLTVEPAMASGQQSAGMEQLVEALFLNEPSPPKDHGHPVVE